MRFATASIAVAAAAGSASAQSFIFTGTNQAGAEFGETVFPGELGRHYTWPTAESIDVSPR
jgi:endoglucanase